MVKNEQVEQITQEASDKIRQRNIKEGLSEIYQDEDGSMIDVQKLSIKPKRHWWWWLVTLLIYAAVLALIGYLVVYFINRNSNAESVELTINADKNLVTGQEFYYVVKYANLERLALHEVNITLDYPDGYIFLEASPQPTSNNNTWSLADLEARRGGEIRIKGKILAAKNKQNIILGEMTYQPDNFSSEFKKVASFESIIADTGLDLNIVGTASAIVGEEQRLIVKYKSKEQGFLDNFRLTVESDFLDNIVLMSQKQDSDKITEVAPWVWQVEGIDKNEHELKLRFKFKDKVATSQTLKLKFEYRYDPSQELMPTAVATEAVKEATNNATASTTDASKDAITATATELVPPIVYYLIAEINQEIEMVKNDLNLNLIINGSDRDQSIDFGQALHYSINYSNKGQSDMEDIAIMAVVDSDLLDWSSLADDNDGIKKNNTITWTKSQIPQLGSLSPQEKGNIDFTINVQSAAAAKSSGYRGDNKIKSYAQFQILADEVTTTEQQNNTSNIIVSSVNSDLQLSEQVRYFNSDNIAVGSGPLPPRVGETTTLRTFWTIDNTLHDLNNVQISSQLPAYVVWSGKEQASLGQLKYDQANHRVIWEIDYLPTNVRQPKAEFGISITPVASNKNQIMVLLSGTKIVAQDTTTGDEISRNNSAKTTKLEDDDMIDSDGVIK
ncbi:MAG: hypothetical protein V1765_00175 [bacterium]